MNRWNFEKVQKMQQKRREKKVVEGSVFFFRENSRNMRKKVGFFEVAEQNELFYKFLPQDSWKLERT